MSCSEHRSDFRTTAARPVVSRHPLLAGRLDFLDADRIDATRDHQLAGGLQHFTRLSLDAVENFRAEQLHAALLAVGESAGFWIHCADVPRDVSGGVLPVNPG